MGRRLLRDTLFLEHILCDLCGCPDYRVLYRKPDDWLRDILFQFPIVQCGQCGLVYVNPRPTKESMEHFYNSRPEYFDRRSSALAFERYRRQRKWLPDLANKRVLDLGCARGDFLKMLLDEVPSIEAYGVDAFHKYVVDDQIRFLSAELENADLPRESFDLVMGWAVMEHVYHPMKTFQAVAQALKPGGDFIFLCTNAHSLYGRWAYREDVPRHLYHFSEDVLAAYAQKVGLNILEIFFDDEIFDGRGQGTFKYFLAKCFGWSWEIQMRNRLNVFHKGGLWLGNLIDRLTFSFGWEKLLRCSGVMVVQMRKSEQSLSAASRKAP